MWGLLRLAPINRPSLHSLRADKVKTHPPPLYVFYGGNTAFISTLTCQGALITTQVKWTNWMVYILPGKVLEQFLSATFPFFQITEITVHFHVLVNVAEKTPRI